MSKYLLNVSCHDLKVFNALANDAMSLGFEPMYPVQFLNNEYFMSLTINRDAEPYEFAINLENQCPNMKKVLGAIIKNTSVQKVLGITEQAIYLVTLTEGVQAVGIHELCEKINDIQSKNMGAIDIKIVTNMGLPYKVIISKDSNFADNNRDGFDTIVEAYVKALETLYVLSLKGEIKRFDTI